MPPQRKPSPLDDYGQYDFPMPSSSRRPPPQSLPSVPLTSTTVPPSPPRPRPSPTSNKDRPRNNRPVPNPIQVGAGTLVRQTSAQRLAEKRREVGLRNRPTWEGEERGPEEEWITEDEEEAVGGGVQRQVRGKAPQTQYAYRPAYFTTGPTYSYPTAIATATTTSSTYSSTPSTSHTPPSPVAPINWDLGYAYKHDPSEDNTVSGYKAVLKTLSLSRRTTTSPMKPTTNATPSPQPKVNLSPVGGAASAPPEAAGGRRSRSPPTQRRPLRYHWEAFSLRVRFGVFKAQKRVMACFTPPA